MKSFYTKNELYACLIRLKEHRLVSGGAYQDEGFVCASPGGGVLSPSRTSQEAKALLTAAGIDRSIHLHDLRHSYATLLKQAGVSIETISALLGHSDIKPALPGKYI